MGHGKCSGTTIHNVLYMTRVSSSCGDMISVLASILGAWFDHKNNLQSVESYLECCETFLFLLIAACLSPPSSIFEFLPSLLIIICRLTIIPDFS